MTFVDQLRDAHARYGTQAQRAFALLRSWYDFPMPRVPGMDTVIRLALRISLGRTIEEAAAKEYIYRWRLALTSSVFGIPHTIGM